MKVLNFNIYRKDQAFGRVSNKTVCVHNRYNLLWVPDIIFFCLSFCNRIVFNFADATPWPYSFKYLLCHTLCLCLPFDCKSSALNAINKSALAQHTHTHTQLDLSRLFCFSLISANFDCTQVALKWNVVNCPSQLFKWNALIVCRHGNRFDWF